MNGPVSNFSIILSSPFLIWMATTLMIFRRSPKLCHSHVQAKTGFLTVNHIFVSRVQSLMGQFRQKTNFRQCCFKVIDIDGVASVLQLFKFNLPQISLLLCKKNFLSFQITAAKGYHCCLFVAQPHHWYNDQRHLINRKTSPQRLIAIPERNLVTKFSKIEIVKRGGQKTKFTVSFWLDTYHLGSFYIYHDLKLEKERPLASAQRK